MRDATAYAMQEANARRSMLVLRQLEFVQTKLQAHEEILASSWKARFMALIDWSSHMRLVDNRQKELLAERDKQMQAAADRVKITPVKLAGVGRG